MRSVIITSPETEKTAARAFPEAGITLEMSGSIQTGKEIIVNEGVKAGLKKKTLLEYLETQNPDLLTKLARQSIKIMPVKVAYDFLQNYQDDIQTLKTYDGELEDFREYVRSLKDTGQKVRPKEMSHIIQGLKLLGKEIDFYAGQKFSAENIRKLLLFNEQSYYPLEGSGITRNFGRLLEERELFAQKK